MNTYFAPAERSAPETLYESIETVSGNPVMTGLLHTVTGLLGVLNEQRQIIALNDSFLTFLGIDDPVYALGMRPGEAVKCVYADTGPGGCGTSKYCSTCGAAIAIVSSLGMNTPVEKVCTLKALKNGKAQDVVLSVRSHPIEIEDRRFLLLFLQDITVQQQQSALERTFFHDINNMLNVLSGASEMLVMESYSELAKTVQLVTKRLLKEIGIQKSLSQVKAGGIQPEWQDCSTADIFEELRVFVNNHPAAQGKHVVIDGDSPQISIRTDRLLLSRVLCNMIINALEASDAGGLVKTWIEQDGTSVSFCVWNRTDISPDIARRIFQRNFSTKNEQGRGIGTYSMKLLGEDILGGHVGFTTSMETGTVFTFSIPK